MKTNISRTFLLLLALLLAGCSSCSGGNASGDGGDTATDTGSDSEIVFGDTTPCVNDPRPGEVCVPGGNYLMGCVPGDTDCAENEKPLVMTTLSPFFIDKKETTIKEAISWINEIKDDPGIEQYIDGLTLTDDTGVHLLWSGVWQVSATSDNINYVTKDSDGEYIFNEAASEECPNQGGINAAAGGFSWLGAKMYCAWKHGRLLPTEAQWEAAARGQTTNVFPCGSHLADCWYGVYGCCGPTEVCYGPFSNLCHCCAPFSADHADVCLSPFGIIGMYGNAAEWTADYISVDHSACADGCVDPQFSEEPYSGAVHVLKGGDMYAPSQSWLRISKRTELNGDDGSSDTGVRCVRPDEPFVMPDAGNDGGK